MINGHGSGAVSPRIARVTRSGRTVHLDRHAAQHQMLSFSLRIIEMSLTVLVLIVISDAILPLYLHSGPQDLVTTPTTPVERAAYWTGYLFTLVQVLIRPNQLLRAAMRNPFVIAIVAIAALSVTWSVDPATSLRRAFALTMWTLFGLYLASRYDTKTLLRLLGVALGLLALMSIASVILTPDYGIEFGFDKGAWRGVFTTKNTLGEMMLLAAVVFGLFASRKGPARVPAMVGVVLAMTLIFFAKATAALLIVAVLAITIPIVLTFRRNNAAAALVLCILLGTSAGASVAIADRDAVLSVLGKDATLTGRTILWSAVEGRIEERPMLGYGYNAFWEANGVQSEQVRTVVGWDTPHSHNGLLDVWLDIGLIGVLALIAAYVLALKRAWIALRASMQLDGVWAMTFLVMLFLGNTTESSISQSFLIWAVFVAVACMRWTPDRRPAPLHGWSKSRAQVG
ncbi:MAG TPA: O-antigen ligase [Gemmatimonadaceae bacterium]|jgi:O-antigen ligase